MIRRPPTSTLFPYTTPSDLDEVPYRFDRMLTHLLNAGLLQQVAGIDRKSTRLNSSHRTISYAVFCLKKKKNPTNTPPKENDTLLHIQTPDVCASLQAGTTTH